MRPRIARAQLPLWRSRDKRDDRRDEPIDRKKGLRMPSEKSLTYYQIGIRFTQALMMLPERDDPIYPTAVMPAVDGVLIAVGIGVDRGFINATVVPSVELLKQTRSAYRTDYSEREFGEFCHRVRIDILGLRQRVDELLNQYDPGEGLLWFQLGQAIVDGADNSWSEGQPYMATDPGSDYQRLKFRDPRPAHWVWNREAQVDDLLRRLGQSRERCFPGIEALSESDWELFPALPRERFWGWRSLETGLRQLRVRPHWDAERRALFVGDTEVHRYSNSAANQIGILEAFQAAGWPRAIERVGRIGGENLQATIRDLNNGISPALIVFRAEGGRTISFELQAHPAG